MADYLRHFLIAKEFINLMFIRFKTFKRIVYMVYNISIR